MPTEILTDQTAGRQGSTKDSLIRAASVLFSQKGYCTATLDDIANACSIQRGSIFYHFPSKQAIAIAAIQYFHQQCEQEIFHPILNARGAPTVILRQFAHAIDRFFTQRDDCNLITFLGLELMAVSPEVKIAIEKFFCAWKTMFYDVFTRLKTSKPIDDVNALFGQSMSFIQGYCTLSQFYPKQATITTSLSQDLLHLWQL